MIHILPRWTLWPRWKRVALSTYLAGGVVSGLWILWSTYDDGGFGRSHTPMDFLLIGGIDLAVILLWPLFWTWALVALLLIWLGVPPR